MRRLLIPLTVLSAAGLTLSVLGMVRLAHRLGGPPAPVVSVLRPDPGLEGLRIGEFAMTDQDGQPATQAVLDGRVTIVDFIFTHCPFACPMMTASMEQVASELGESAAGKEVRFLSISVDPEHDTPAALKAFAQQRSLDLSRWTMLTGDAETVNGIVRGLEFALAPDPTRTIPLAEGGTMNNITHPTKLLLIGPDRRVLGIYSYDREDEIRALKDRALRAVGTMREGR
jgi:protein SCO1/2